MKFFLSLLLLTIFTFTTQAQDWQLKKDKNGIKVYVRTHTGSKLKESKAVMTTSGTIDNFLDLLLDFENYNTWTPKAKTGKLLKKINDKTYYFYADYKAPMVADRDLAAKLTITKQTDSYLRIDMEGAPDYTPEKDKHVRIPEYKGIYIVEKQSDGKLKITLEYFADPGGNVPSGLVNTSAVDVPYDLFSNLKTLL